MSIPHEVREHAIETAKRQWGANLDPERYRQLAFEWEYLYYIGYRHGLVDANNAAVRALREYNNKTTSGPEEQSR